MKNKPLAALSSAAIVAVYAAGFVRTRAAAERFDAPTPPRRPLTPGVTEERAAPRVEGRLEIPAPTPAPAIAPRVQPAPRETSSTDAPAPVIAPPPSDVPAPSDVSEQAVQGLAQPTVDAAPPEPPTIARALYKDGTYTGWGYCRHGDLQAAVTIEAGRIISAKVVQCLTRYSCNWIEPLYPQVVQRQSAAVDYISGASESSDAFYDAVSEALKKAK
jgi:fumarate reductase flavoprotein subunit